MLDTLLAMMYTCQQGGDKVSPSNSPEYYRKRRETIGQFSVPLSREKLSALTEKLKMQNKTKTQWLNEKVDEELGK